MANISVERKAHGAAVMCVTWPSLGPKYPSLSVSIGRRAAHPDSRTPIQPEWMLEIKVARFQGDNGKPDDTAIKDILSPFEDDLSALTDCVRKAMIIYGVEAPRRPLLTIARAFEIQVGSQVVLGPAWSAAFSNLRHPVHSAG